MNKKQAIRINENQLKQIVEETVKMFINETIDKNEVLEESRNRVRDVMAQFWIDFNQAESRIKTIMYKRRSKDRYNYDFKQDDEVLSAEKCLHDIKTVIMNNGWDFRHPSDKLYSA